MSIFTRALTGRRILGSRILGGRPQRCGKSLISFFLIGKKKQQEILAAEQVTCCGSACRTCGCYGSLCKGCNETRGRVFHAPEGRACPIYACAVEQKELKSCKTCGSLPCEIWMQTKDPSMSQEAFERNVKERAERLKRQ